MDYKELQPKVRARSVCELLDKPSQERGVLGMITGPHQPIVEGTITIAMSRYPRENTKASARLAMMLALSESARVVYLNTYAGDELMQESFTAAALLSPENIEAFGINAPDYDPRQLDLASLPFDYEKLNDLVIVNIPFGGWDSAAIAAAIPNGDAPLVIVLNDIELAGFSAWQRQRVTRDLLRLHEATNATMVIFSHEMRTDIRAGEPGRGALGILAMRAEAVYHFFGPFDHLIHTRNPIERATIHEAQTQVSEVADGYRLTRNSLEAGLEMFEIPGSLMQPLPNPPLLQREGLSV